MASQLYVSGPVQISVGTGASFAYEFLGWTEGDLVVSLGSDWEDVIADYGGPRLPVDVQYFGEQAFIPFTLVRFQFLVLNKLTARLADATAGGTPGTMATGELGSLMLAEGHAVPLLLYSPYVLKSAFSATMPGGYLFGAAWLVDNFDHPMSSRVTRPRCVMRAIEVWNPVANTAVLYSRTLPSPLPTPV